MRAEATRQLLLDTARALMEHNGSASVGLVELSAASGVSNGSIYHHFGSKDGVLAAVLVDAVAKYQAAASALLDLHHDDLAGGVAAMIEHRLRWARDNRAVAALLLEQRHLVVSPQWRDELKASSGAFIERCRHWLEHLAEIDALARIPIELAHPIVFAPAEEIARLWLREQLTGDPMAFAGPLAAAAVAALCALPQNPLPLEQDPR
ncbi:MAG: TetR/AcrR family transcriptional regulator [Mycobacterium sp.]